MGADYRQLAGARADLSSCDWAPPGKLALRSGAPDLLRAPARLADELQAAGAHVGIGLHQYVPFHSKGQS